MSMNPTHRSEPSLLSFPCEFPIKVVGRFNPEFEGAVMQIMRQHAPDLTEGAVKERVSQESKYVSMTVTIKATSQQQLDAIYQALSENSLVIAAF